MRSHIAEAVGVAKTADVPLLVLGGNEDTNKEGWADKHLGDRDSIDLVGAQNDLVKAILGTGKPTVVLLIEARVDDLVGRMTFEETVSQMMNAAPAIERLGIPQYDWWNEALHGVARPGLRIVTSKAKVWRWQSFSRNKNGKDHFESHLEWLASRITCNQYSLLLRSRRQSDPSSLTFGPSQRTFRQP